MSHQPRNLDSGALCRFSGGTYPVDPPRAAGPTREHAHPSPRDTTSCQCHHTAGRSPRATQVHDPGVSYGLRIFWPWREHLSGSQQSTSTCQEAPACLKCVCCHETAIPPGITAAAFAQAEPHSYCLAKFSKFRLSSTLQKGRASRELRITAAHRPCKEGPCPWRCAHRVAQVIMERKYQSSHSGQGQVLVGALFFAIRNSNPCRHPPCKCFFCASLQATPPTPSACTAAAHLRSAAASGLNAFNIQPINRIHFSFCFLNIKAESSSHVFAV